VALTRAVEGLIVIRKPKESVFDEIGMEPLCVGTLRVEHSGSNLQREKMSQSIVLSNYGTQETSTLDEEEEKDYEAILFGTALHYALEMLGTFDEVSLSTAIMSMNNRYGQQLSSESKSEIEQRIRALIENQAFQTLLQGAKVRKEQSLSFEGELKQIDLLLEYENYYLVIDYKSSKKYAMKHQNQVGYYKKAITNITGKRTEGMIIYILEGEIESINLK
jgi:exodeoxyribonuclease V beta subunit